MSSNKHKDIAFHPLHYLFVIVGTIAMLLLELHVQVLANGLIYTPFILVTTAAAIMGDFGSGVFAIFATVLAVGYLVPSAGYTLTEVTVFKTFEYALVNVVIFSLSWRSRGLQASNTMLRNMTLMLQEVTTDLQAEARGNEKQLQRLNAVNKGLVSIVNRFVEDDDYWARRLPLATAPYPKGQTARRSRK